MAPTETLVVTGTRTTGAPLPAPTVLDDGVLLERNAITVADALARVPGMYVSAPSGRGGVSSLFWRGAEPNFTTVLIDGVQVNDPTNSRGGSFDLSLLNVDDIERMELVSGPLSSIYGSDALGGVINVITREPADVLTGRFAAEVGSGDYGRVGAAVAGPLAVGGFSAALSHAEQGDSRGTAMHRGSAATARLEIEAREAQRISLNARVARAEASAFPDASGGPELAVLRAHEHREAHDSTVGAQWTLERAERADIIATASWFAHDEQQISPGVAPGILDGLPASALDNDFTRSNFAIHARYSPMGPLEGIVGVNWRHERADSSGRIEFAPDVAVATNYTEARDIGAAYAELGLNPTPRMDLTLAVRADHARPWGTETTSRFGFQFRLNRVVERLTLTWGEGFKLPSLFSLGHPLVGNAALEPEHARALELGAELAVGQRWTIETRAYAQRFRDIIDFDFETFRAVNRARADSDGVELALRLDHGRGGIRVHATALDIDLPDGGPPLTQRPERLAGVDGFWAVGRAFDIFVAWRYVGARHDSSIPSGPMLLGAYHQLDLGLDWRSPGDLAWRLSIDNLADEHYESSIGFPAQGRILRVALRRELLL